MILVKSQALSEPIYMMILVKAFMIDPGTWNISKPFSEPSFPYVFPRLLKDVYSIRELQHEEREKILSLH